MESPCPIQIQEENEAKKERVFILSAFPEFLADYFSIKLWKTCVKHRNNQLETHLCFKTNLTLLVPPSSHHFSQGSLRRTV